MGAAFRVGHGHRGIEQVGWGNEIQIQRKSGIFVDWVSIVGGAATTEKVWLIVISWATSSAWCGVVASQKSVWCVLMGSAA